MKKFALTGYPLGHSMSPLIHKELFKICNTDATYELKEISPSDLEQGIGELKTFSGFNVTIPHKTAVIPYLDKLSQRASLFGAVNTVDNRDGVLTGYNTDCFGFLKSLEMSGIMLGGNVLLCGSGGVSRMFAFESVMAGADLTIAVRDADVEAANLIKQEIWDKLEKEISVITLDEVCKGYDLMINATPVGMYPNVESSILSREQVHKCGAVFDAVYNPVQTKLLSFADEAGIKYSNGLPMLVWQAAVAQQIWFDTEFSMDDVKKVIEITKRELEKI